MRNAEFPLSFRSQYRNPKRLIRVDVSSGYENIAGKSTMLTVGGGQRPFLQIRTFSRYSFFDFFREKELTAAKIRYTIYLKGG